MNVEKDRKVVVAKWFDIKFTFALLMFFDSLAFAGGAISIFKVSNEATASILYDICVLIILESVHIKALTNK